MSSSILDTAPPSADHRIRYGEGDYHFGDLRLPSGPAPYPVVVAIHGGFWRSRYDLEHLGHLCAALATHGMASFSLEYRRIGHAGGGVPGTLDDVARGADFLRQLAPRHGLDLERVVALGHSAGGHLALMLAARAGNRRATALGAPPLALRGVVALAAVSDLARGYRENLGDGVVGAFVGGSPEALAERYAEASPAALLPLGVAQTLVHGTEDDTVPYAFSVDYVARAKRAGDVATLVTLPGAGHFDVIVPGSSAWPSVVEAVASLLDRPAG